MTTKTTKEAVHQVIGAYFAQNFTDATKFADIDADSMDMVELQMDIEDAIEIEIPDAALFADAREAVDMTVGELVGKVEAYVLQRKAA